MNHVEPAIQEMAGLVQVAADEEILPRFLKVTVQTKADGTLVTEADFAVQERLGRELADRWPAIGLLGEEMTRDSQEEALDDAGKGLWCLDPLDGTSNFASGIPYFGVSLAFVKAGRVQAGVVYDPVRRECFSAVAGGGAWLNGRPLQLGKEVDALQRAMAIIDFKRLPGDLAFRLSQSPPYRSQRSFGSVALDWCWMAAGRCQLYLHGSQKLWDYAAGSLVFREAGGSGGLLENYRGDWVEQITLASRIAVGASNTLLLEHWRQWLLAAQDVADSD